MEELFASKGWRIVREEAALPDGRVKSTVRAHRCDSVHILASPGPQELLMLREFRPFYGDYIWMVPSGKMDKETDPLVAAQRELREETGYAAGKMEFYCSCRHSESLVQENHFFIASDLSPSPLPQDDTELIEVHVLTVQEAIDRVLKSPVIHTASAFALLRYARDFGK